MIYHWLFLITTLGLCIIAGMPTRFWMRMGEWITSRALRGKQVRLWNALGAQHHPFTPDTSFIERGVGLAMDHTRNLVFLAVPEGGQMKARILPRSALSAHAARMQSDNGFHQYFVEIITADSANPVWRLSCENATLAAEIADTLSQPLASAECRNGGTAGLGHAIQ